MAAEVLIRQKHGAGETAVDKTSGTVRPKAAGDATVDTNDPLVIPTSGQVYSFEVFLRLYIGSTGPDVEITDLEFYTDGSNSMGTGVKLWVTTVAAYTTPAAPNTSNDPPQAPVNGTPGAMDNAFDYVTGSRLSLGSGPFSSTTSDMGLYLILVVEVESTAGPGTTTSETLTFAYKEI